MSAKPQRSLGAATAIGALWTSGSRWGMRLIGLGSTVVLARVLTPEDFGLVAIVMAVYAMLDSFSTFSPNQFLIRSKTLAPHLLDTAFTLTVLRGLLLSLLVVVTASLLPVLTADPHLQQIAYVIATLPLINGLRNPRITEYQREMNFAYEASRQIVTKLIGVAVTISVALIWKTYWALIAGLLVKELLWLPVGYTLKPYRPRFGLRDARDFLNFSIWLTAENIVTTLSNHLDRLLVAGMANVKTVGSYAIGKEFSWLVAGEFFATMDRVLFPSITRLGNDPAGLRAGVRDIFTTLTAVSLPWVVGAAFFGPELILLLYGPQWEQTAALITPLLLFMAFQSTSTTARALAMATGKTRLLVIRTAAVTALRLVLFVLLMRSLTLEATLYWLLPVSLLAAAINLIIIRQLSGVPALSLLARSGRSWASVGLMAAALYALGKFIPEPSAPLALVGTIAAESSLACIVYVVSHLALWRLAGRPQGAETRLLGLAGSLYRRIRPARHANGN